jgi:predicted PurR-regulated permease PerM
MKFGQWLGLLSLLAALILLWSLRNSLVLMASAVVLAMALCTLVGTVRDRIGGPRWIALLISLVGLAVVIVVMSTAVFPPFFDQFSQLIAELPRAGEILLNMLHNAASSVSQMLYGSRDGSLEWLKRIYTPSAQDRAAIAGSIGSGALQLLGLAGNLGTGLLKTLFVVAVALMIAIQPVAYREAVILLVPSFYRRRFRQVLQHCGQALSAWLVGVLISSLCVGVLAAIGLSMLGVKLVAANAVLAGMLNIIPNVGPTLSTVFPMAVALLDSPWKPLAVLVLYVVIQNLESYLITPSVMQHQVKLLPGLTLIAQLLFTVVFGPLGLLLALPLAVCLQVFLREILIQDVLDPWKRQRLGT